MIYARLKFNISQMTVFILPKVAAAYEPIQEWGGRRIATSR